MLQMALRDWIWFREGYASEEKVPTDIAKWKFLISQLKTLNTKATLQVHSPPPKNRETKDNCRSLYTCKN